MERVIFDTNGYRSLIKDLSVDEIDDLIAKLREKEKRNNIQASISLIVAQELLAHVASPNKGSLYSKSLNAIKAMYLHCFEDGHSQILAGPDSLVAKYIFNIESKRRANTNFALFEMIEAFAKSPNEATFQRFAHNLAKNRAFIREAEKIYADDILKFFMAHDPAMKNWKVFDGNEPARKDLLKLIRSHEFSKGLAGLYCYHVLNGYIAENPQIHRPTESEWSIISEKFIKNFPEFIALYKSVYENVLGSNFNLYEKDRGNFWWDTLLMLNVGEHRIENDKLYFVTNDNAVLRTARENNGKNSILTFGEYMEYLGD